ncbi:MAG TPA: zinc ribbon domain-containing protein [Armatimonadota bacterium]|nr:zinc ribbon domain-containing protein [Armatimonadota bacterium]HOP79979.1 zinc ribbon domain-containing protein [Armatimonadota bacterium]HPP74831.1 zinc ribbon domain-containing protein [Armatimonadota bacterium]
MPTYEYECLTCGHNFECFQKMTDDPISICPECGGSTRRLMGTGGGIMFKGSGFHVNDYASDCKNPKCNRESPCCRHENRCSDKPCHGDS